MRRALVTLLLWPALALAGPYEDAERAYAAADYARAEALYAEALAHPEALPVSTAEAKSRLGLALRKQGTDLGAAERWLDAAIAEGTPEIAARAKRYLARLYVDRNELDRGQALLEELRAWHAKHGPAKDALAVLLELGAVQVLRAEPARAIETYDEATERAHDLPDEHLEAVALLGLAEALMPTRDFGTVTWLARQAAELEARHKQWAAAATARVYEAVGLAGAENYHEAQQVAGEALPWVQQMTQARRSAVLVIAHSLLRTGAPEAALREIDRELDGHSSGGSPVHIEHLLLQRAEALIALRRLDEARGSLERAREFRWGQLGRAALEGLTGQIAFLQDRRNEALARFSAMERAQRAAREGLEPARLVDFFAPLDAEQYELYVHALLDAGRVDDEARVVEEIRSRSFTDSLLRAHTAGGEPASSDESHRRLSAGAKFLDHLSASDGPIAHEFDPQSFQSSLPADLAVLDYYLLPDEVVVRWWTRDHRVVRRIGVNRDRAEQAIDDLIGRIARRDPEYQEAARRVTTFLLGPVDDLLRAAPQTTLCVIPHRALHRLPFAALPLHDALLVDRWRVLEAPSLGALAAMLARPPSAVPIDRVLAVGDVGGDLTGARAEVHSLAKRLPTSTTLLGSAATEAAVKSLLPAVDIAHFAVHGFPARRGAPAYLALARGPSDDGRLEAEEVTTLHIGAHLVVLSACDVGVGVPNAGDEIPGVLNRAFLLAGAETVVAARWRISDEATRAFMEVFYRTLLGGGSRLDAFVAAQRSLRRGETTDLDGAGVASRGDGESRTCVGSRGVTECVLPAGKVPPEHPYYWASFSFVGEYRR